MRRLIFPLLAGLVWFFPAPALHAQVDAEDVRRLNATVEALLEGQEVFRQQIQELQARVDRLRAENADLKQQLAGVGKDNVSRPELQKVVEQLREVDARRASDAELVQRQLKDLAETLSKPVTPPRPPPVAENPPDSKDAEVGASGEPPYVHEVAAGDTVSGILDAYNKAYGLKVKQADFMKANPKLKDPKRIFVGQKVNIPVVK